MKKCSDHAERDVPLSTFDFRLSTVTVAILFLLVLPVLAQTLEVRSNQTLQGSHILLRDIVKDPLSLPRGWAERDVLKAPSPGTAAEYSISSIAYALQKYPDMIDVVLRGNMKLTMKRTSMVLPSAKITKAVTRFVENHKKWAGTKFEVRCEPLDTSISVSTDKAEAKVKGFIQQKQANRFRFDVEILVDGAVEQTVPVYGKVVPVREVWVARRTLNRGHKLSADSLGVLPLAADEAAGMIPTTEPIEGMEMNRLVRANQPLKRHFLIEPVCAQKGDLVSVSIVRGGLDIVLRARALATGRRGDKILCMNERSKRRLLVRLADTRQATIDY